MAKYVLDRDLVVANKSGRGVRLIAGIATYVPPALETDVLAQGAKRVDAAEGGVKDAADAGVAVVAATAAAAKKR